MFLNSKAHRCDDELAILLLDEATRHDTIHTHTHRVGKASFPFAKPLFVNFPPSLPPSAYFVSWSVRLSALIGGPSHRHEAQWEQTELSCRINANRLFQECQTRQRHTTRSRRSFTNGPFVWMPDPETRSSFSRDLIEPTTIATVATMTRRRTTKKKKTTSTTTETKAEY